jgi:hypothetical protein
VQLLIASLHAPPIASLSPSMISRMRPVRKFSRGPKITAANEGGHTQAIAKCHVAGTFGNNHTRCPLAVGSSNSTSAAQTHSRNRYWVPRDRSTKALEGEHRGRPRSRALPTKRVINRGTSVHETTYISWSRTGCENPD